MTTPPTAIVVGAGIAGLSAAIALRRAGYAVSIVERSPVLLSPPVPLCLWPNAIEALDRLGLLQAVIRRAHRISSTSIVTVAGHVGIQTHETRFDDAKRAYLVRRTDLHAALFDAAAGISIALGRAVSRVDQSPTVATVRFKDGRALTADFVVAADGIWSDTATAIVGTTATHRGYGGVMAIANPADGVQRGAARDYRSDDERFGLVDFGGERNYWYYLCRESAPDEAAGLTHDAVLARAAGWPAPIARVVAATPPSQLVPFSIHARPAPRLLGIGRVLCVGDAAHAMEPTLGQGGCQALEDAVALGVAAGAGRTTEIVRRFEAMRLARIRHIVTRAAEGGLGGGGGSAFARLRARLMPTRIDTHIAARFYRMPRY